MEDNFIDCNSSYFDSDKEENNTSFDYLNNSFIQKIINEENEVNKEDFSVQNMKEINQLKNGISLLSINKKEKDSSQEQLKNENNDFQLTNFNLNFPNTNNVKTNNNFFINNKKESDLKEKESKENLKKALINIKEKTNYHQNFLNQNNHNINNYTTPNNLINPNYNNFKKNDRIIMNNSINNYSSQSFNNYLQPNGYQVINQNYINFSPINHNNLMINQNIFGDYGKLSQQYLIRNNNYPSNNLNQSYPPNFQKLPYYFQMQNYNCLQKQFEYFQYIQQKEKLSQNIIKNEFLNKNNNKIIHANQYLNYTKEDLAIIKKYNQEMKQRKNLKLNKIQNFTDLHKSNSDSSNIVKIYNNLLPKLLLKFIENSKNKIINLSFQLTLMIDNRESFWLITNEIIRNFIEICINKETSRIIQNLIQSQKKIFLEKITNVLIDNILYLCQDVNGIHVILKFLNINSESNILIIRIINTNIISLAQNIEGSCLIQKILSSKIILPKMKYKIYDAITKNSNDLIHNTFSVYVLMKIIEANDLIRIKAIFNIILKKNLLKNIFYDFYICNFFEKVS